MTTNGIVKGFTPAELGGFEATLLDRRTQLVTDLRAIEEAEPEGGTELSPLTTHLADLGSERAASDLSLGCRETATAEIRDIDEALERIHDGSFGLCETCDLAISKERLEAIPYARLCLACKKLEET